MTRLDADGNAEVGTAVGVATGTPTATAPSANRVEPSGTRLDAWWGRLLTIPGAQRFWYWGGPIAVTLLAAVLRLVRLGDPRSLVFDETFYVKDAWTLLNLGYEGSWPDNADRAFNAGDVSAFTTSGSYVAHPPLGKWMIALGLRVFGAQDTVGWRISTAIVGILAVFLLVIIARALFHSTLLATIAGGLFAIDGHAIVMSRTALLDNFVMIFTLLGFGAILLDRSQSATRLSLWLARRADAGRGIDWGPAIWWRPWLLSAGILFGAASAVKWSGLYFLAAFAVYSLVVDALARRAAGIPFFITGTIVKQGPITFLLTIPLALATYLASWTGWFVTKGGYFRNFADTPGNAATGVFSWVPHSVQSFFHYQSSVYDFNVNENSAHPYSANPFGWLFLLRPTAFYYVGQPEGQGGCSYASCAQYVTSIANPILWWAATAALFYLVYRLVRYREWRVGLILMGMVAGYLPWLLYSNRTIFQFYAIIFEPYLILGLVFVIGLILGRPDDSTYRRTRGMALVAVFLFFVVLLSAFFYPVWTGMQVPELFARLHYWLPGWR
ncbi:dolichyl-phosphate-mannose--protein mannosyltransferase [Frigoribacterium sp. CG_9.8]|uniref:dolichyl-phosphate-mannose--protein mannosyltransferase n=1 Tax=Frigoribacterium sp. CG_9.8 TaxID=2787733 RepID=UPI001A1D0CD5|nr:dolichyl-phosphate-mannose--protein O-mannosyl transferase [Frigoribacterium sp. CG_9.8]